MGVLPFWVLFLLRVVRAATDQADVGSLQVIYTSLNQPPQLTGWKTNGGDPCGESWLGVSCSGSSVVSIKISGLGLNGTMGYALSNLLSLKTLDFSNNNIHDTIPYQLPPNVTYLNLAHNNLSGNLPYSITTMVSLNYLNVSQNLLAQPIGDLFLNLKGLSVLDLSFNNFTGDLPSSLGSLSNLSTLDMQNNQLTGPINVLANLSLKELNIANNHFTGWVPSQLSNIPNLVSEGNNFSTGPAPPPPPYTPPPPGSTGKSRGSGTTAHKPTVVNDQSGSKRLAAGAIVGIVMGSIVVAVVVLVGLVLCLRKIPKGGHTKETAISNSLEIHSLGSVSNMEVHEQMAKVDQSVASLKPLSADKMVGERLVSKATSGKRGKSPITAASYTIACLQTATNSFSQECLVGEGSLGRVYRAEFPNGKVLAVKKIDNSALSLQEEDNFLEAVSNMSRLRHPNITALLGYCVEHGQHLLVYDFYGNGTLHDMLHFTEDSTKILTWNTRVRIALGTARALEYLHEVCLPSVVHRNFKSANILLDDELNPHLSDCGLAALTPNTERQVSTQMLDSFGYSAPEFAMSGTYTVKSDVYSFGVVMLELLTGRKPLDSSRQRSEQSLVRWAIPQLHDIDALAKMVDPALKGMYPAKSLSRFADIIAICVQAEPEFRPPMSEVVQALVRLMQRASANKRRSNDETSFSYKIPEHDPSDLSI
ncbi:unnamed protein product [Victoria cruziana]